MTTEKQDSKKAKKLEKQKRHPRTYGELMAQQRSETAESADAGKTSVRKSAYSMTAAVKGKGKRGKAVRPNVDPIFLILLCILLAAGLLMMFSASYATALRSYKSNYDSLYYVKRQAIFIVIGFVGMYVASRIDYRNYSRLRLPAKMLEKPFWKKVSDHTPIILYGIVLVLLALTLLMTPHNNARRWIDIGSISFQPSDIMKFVLVVVFASYIDKHYKDIAAHSFKNGVLYYVVFLVPVALILLFQPHISCTIIILMMAAVMMFIGGTKLRYFFGLAGCAAAGIVGIVVFKGVDYVQERLAGWLNPMADISDTTWQTLQSLVCIATGGTWGLGFGNSYQKYQFLPEPQNDFVFAIVCEELGFVGALVVMILFALLIWRGYTIASKSKDRFGFMLGVGLMSQIAIQTILNIAVVANAIPNTGVSLPFFSYGGTSLCILMTEMGIILNISRSVNGMRNR